MEEKRKIAMVALDLSRTGISTVIMNFCRYRDKKEFQVELLVGEGVVEEYERECRDLSVKLLVLPSKHRDPAGYYKELFEALKQGNYDIVHVHGNSAMILPELFLARLAGCRARVAHSHNITCDHVMLHRLLRPFFFLFYEKGIACSIQAGQWMFGKRLFEVLANGIDAERYAFSEEICKKAFLIGHVAQYTPQKNHGFLLEVFSLVADREEAAKLLLVGDGMLFEEISSKVKEHPFRERIHILGDVQDMPGLYSRLNLCVLPSLFEGLPLVLVEAQASGLTCLVSDRVPKAADMTGDMKFIPIASQNAAKLWKEAILEEIAIWKQEKQACEKHGAETEEKQNEKSAKEHCRKERENKSKEEKTEVARQTGHISSKEYLDEKRRKRSVQAITQIRESGYDVRDCVRRQQAMYRELLGKQPGSKRRARMNDPKRDKHAI